MAKTDFAAQGVSPLGSAYNTKQLNLGIPGGPNANEGGTVFIERIDGSGDPQDGIWLHTDGTNLLYTTGGTKPADTNTGTAITAGGADTALSNIASVQIPDAGDLIPLTDNQVDIGEKSTPKEFKDAYFDGTVETDALEVDGDAYFGRTGGAGSNYIKILTNGVATLHGTATIDGVGAGDVGDITANETVTGLWDFSNASGLKAAVITDRATAGIAIDGVTIKDDDIVMQSAKDIMWVNTSTAYIQHDGSNLIFFDSDLGTTVTLTSMAGGALTSPTITGDATISDGKLTWNDLSDEVAGAWAFSNVTNDAIDITANSATTSNILHIQTTSLTSGNGILVTTDESVLSSGYYYQAYDSNSAEVVWQVGENGVNTITGKAGDVLVLTLGDLQMTNGDIDMDRGRIDVLTSDDEQSLTIKRTDSTGTAAVAKIWQSHATPTSGVLHIDQDGTGDADAVQIDNAGTGYAVTSTGGAAGSEGYEFISAASGTGHGLYLDGATSNWIGPASAFGFAQIDNDGNHANTGSTLLRVNKSGGQLQASTTGSVAQFIDNSSVAGDGYAVLIDASGVTEALHVDAGKSVFDEHVTIKGLTATTNASVETALIHLDSSGVVAANFGAALEFSQETDTSPNTEYAGAISFPWLTATDGSEDSYLLVQTTKGGTKDTSVLRVDDSANIIVGGGAAADGTATNGIAIPDGTPPAALKAGYTQLYADDQAAVAGHDCLHQFAEAGGKWSIDNGAGTVNTYTYYASVADDGNHTLPFSITASAYGMVTAGNNEERAFFWVDDDGDVTLSGEVSGNVVANADTDAKLCIGTAATQEPLVVKNRLGGAKNIFLVIWYN